MYRLQGRVVIAVGDPVAAEASFARRSPLRGGGVRLIKRIEQLSLSVELYKGAANATPKRRYIVQLSI